MQKKSSKSLHSIAGKLDVFTLYAKQSEPKNLKKSM